jgi:23S rRNA pseudouridine955/2504/2580 synthase/23S rRNA pseudouridine1911/1915/1917 synthase
MKENADILFESDSLLAINKPPGILSVPDRYRDDRFSIAGWVLSSHPTARPLHRLDFETSGVLLFCTLPEAFGWYSDQFEQRLVTKTYHVIIEGRISKDEGTIDVPLFTQSNGKVIVTKKGKNAVTQWKAIEKFIHHTFIEANPLTGRTHQIRVHLASIGHPVLCDVSYGASGPLLLSALKGKHRYQLSKDAESENPILERVALHAGRIEILDFTSKKPVNIECPIPKDLSVVLRKLRQYTSLVK